MGCNNNEGVLSGILGECNELILGCLTVTDGEPAENPLSDMLPIQYDPDLGHLWVWYCNDVEGSGEWINVTYSICGLESINQQEVDEATTVLIAACVDGVDVLIPPTTPICELPIVQEAAFAGLTTLEMIGCADGVPSRFNDLPICQITGIADGPLNDALSVRIVACVDGRGGLVNLAPLLPTMTTPICDHPEMNDTDRDDATVVKLAACVDGTPALINPIQLCSLGSIDQTAVDDAASVEIAACVDGADVLIPNNQPIVGSWDVEIEDNSTTGVFNYSEQIGTYTVIGDVVFFYISIIGNWSTLPSGALRYTLPFDIALGRRAIANDILHNDLNADSNLISVGVSGTTMNLNTYDINGGLVVVSDIGLISPLNTLTVTGTYIKAP